METKPQLEIFDFKEIVTGMIRERGLTEGIWQLYVEFQIVAANMPFGDPQNPKAPKGPEDGPAPFLLPTAMIPISKIGLLQVDKISPLAVDASRVNAKPTRRTPKQRVEKKK